MTEKPKPQIVTESSLPRPFGRRFFDQAIRQSKRTKSQKFIFGVVGSLLFLVMALLWKKIPKNFVANFAAKELPFVLEALPGATIDVPPLVLKIKPEVAPVTFGFKPSKISVVNFVGAGSIPPGAEAKAVLLSGATNGMIKAQLVEPLKVDGASILDTGTLLIGEGQSSDERLFIRFSKAVFKNGKFIRVTAQGYDLADKILGLKGSRVGDYSTKLAASSGLYFISGLAAGLKTNEVPYPGQAIKPSVSDAALNGVSTAAGEQAKSYLESVKNKGPVIEVNSGTTFIVTFEGSEQ